MIVIIKIDSRIIWIKIFNCEGNFVDIFDIWKTEQKGEKKSKILFKIESANSEYRYE